MTTPTIFPGAEKESKKEREKSLPGLLFPRFRFSGKVAAGDGKSLRKTDPGGGGGEETE